MDDVNMATIDRDLGPRGKVGHLPRQPPRGHQRGQRHSLREGALYRFQANRPLAEEMTGHQITFTTLRFDTEAGRRVSSTADCAQDSPPSTPAVGASHDPPRSVEKVRALRLHNPHNLCYANSVTVSLLWMMVQHPGELDTVLGHSTGAQVLMSLLQSRGQPLCLLQMLTWQPIWRDWRRPTQQHDAHEFFAHIQDRISLPGFDETGGPDLTVEVPIW